MSATSFKIYNRGKRLFLHHDINIVAGRTTTIPAEHAESARKLLADYPRELIEAGADDTVTAAIAAESTGLKTENAQLKEQVARLQSLLVSDESAGELAKVLDERDALKAKAEALEAELAEARKPHAAAQVLAKQPDHPKAEKAAKPAPAPKK